MQQWGRRKSVASQPAWHPAPLPFEEQVCTIYSGTAGYLDSLPGVSDVGPFEEKLLTTMRTTYPEVLQTIKTEAEVSDATEAKLKEICQSLVDTY